MSRNGARQLADTIGLSGDDDLALLRDIEGSFAVAFGNETADWMTVGDIYTALLERVPVSKEVGKCATSMAFYRLRSALTNITGVECRLTPSTKLREFAAISPRRLSQRLSEELGVRRPPIPLSLLGIVGALAALLSGVVSIAFHGLWPTVILAPLGLAMTTCDAGAFGATTIGDLARTIASMNFRRFAEDGADHRPQRIWDALCAIIADQCGIEPARIKENTRLLA